MTRTEEIANEVFNRHMASVEVENLGYLATTCELRAVHAEPGSAASAWWTAQEKRYREAQFESSAPHGGHVLFMPSALKKCRTIDCTTKVAGADFCPRCEEEWNGEPYPLSGILMDIAPGRRLTWGIALICVAAIIISFVWR